MRAAPAALGVLAAALLVAGCGSGPTLRPTASHSAAPTAAAPTPTGTATPTPAATPTPSPRDVYPLVAALAGRLSGSWNNSTYGTAGSMTWQVVADPATRTVAITVTLTGQALGASAPPPERIVLTHLAEGVISGHSAAFGDVAGTVSPEGMLAVRLTLLPIASILEVDVGGSIADPRHVALGYTVRFANGASATGTVSLARA